MPLENLVQEDPIDEAAETHAKHDTGFDWERHEPARWCEHPIGHQGMQMGMEVHRGVDARCGRLPGNHTGAGGPHGEVLCAGETERAGRQEVV